MSEERRGIGFGVAAYLLWGVFPLYFPLLEPAGAFEILAHRVVWSSVTMLLLVLATRRFPRLRAMVGNRRTLGLLALASVAISANWSGYIWGVNNGYVVEAALGYFINPLVTIFLGVLVERERLRPVQWVAIAIGMAAVVVLAVGYGRPPWIGLLLAFSFGTYGLLKKRADAGAIESLAVETAVVTPIALAFLAVLAVRGQSHFLSLGAGHTVLFMLTGVVTAVPLICFGVAATRVPLTVLGLLQYVAPILQFALGVLYFHEDMPVGRWIGFALVWLALVVFTAEALRHRRLQLVAAV